MPASTVVDFVYPYGVSAGNHSHRARTLPAVQSPITKQIALLFYVHSDYVSRRFNIKHEHQWNSCSTDELKKKKKEKRGRERNFFKNCIVFLWECTSLCSSSRAGFFKDHLRFKMLLGSPVQDWFPSISVSVTLLSILIKYVSRPQALTTTKMETSNSGSSKRKSEGSEVFFISPLCWRKIWIQIIMYKA